MIPGLGRSPGGGQDNPLQYSCLENPMDRGAWQATVHGVTESRTQLKLLSTHEVPKVAANLSWLDTSATSGAGGERPEGDRRGVLVPTVPPLSLVAPVSPSCSLNFLI